MHSLLSAAAVVCGVFFSMLLVPVAVFAMQVLWVSSAQLKRRDEAEGTGRSEPKGRLAVLVPAHNEAAGIMATLGNLKAQLNPGDRLLVVADNCTDNTADISRSCGVEVVERHHDELRGKGYALDFGLRHLSGDPPDVLVIVDADCTLEPQALQKLAQSCAAADRPAQGLYLMHAPLGASLGLRVSAFAWRIKNWLRPLGALRWGAPCPLMGTGMAFPWHLIQQAPLAHGHLVEDMKLGIDLACMGAPPLFVPGACINSWFPLKREAALAQRTRWEHGHLSMLIAEGPSLLKRSLLTLDARLAAMALDLMVPPLTLLLGLVLAAVAVGCALAMGKSWVPLCIATAALILMLTAMARSWWLIGRDLISARDLLHVLVHAFCKLAIYLKFITHRQKEWVRTDRHDSGP